MSRAVVVGSGPNGLAAAIALLQGGLEVEVREAADSVGGGLHSAELTLPGFVHDVCASVLPLAVGSPFFRTLALDVEWVHPDAPAAHPLDDGSAVVLERGLEETVSELGSSDGAAYRRLVEPLVEGWDELAPALLGRVPPPPRRGLRATRAVGLRGFAVAARAALGDARSVAESLFETDQARAWFAGHCAHSMLPLERRPSAGVGLALAVLGHAVGWPLARGGSQSLADALAGRVRELGGSIVTGREVDELPAGLVLADVSPRELVRLARGRLPGRYEQRLRSWRQGPGVFKVDWALDGPIPWRAEDCRRAGTVHLGGTLDEISRSEWDAWSGRVAERPFVLLVQPTLFDPTRAPAGKHVAWAYCHVPNGSDVDATARIEAQVERFAPGFRELVLARSSLGPSALEARNRNLVGGDINGGAMDLGQVFRRPAARLVPWSTPLEGVYLCSASTPPGGGVHGMCGYHAARAALR